MSDAKPLTREERDRLEALATAATQWPTHYSPGDRSYGEEEQFLIICDDDARELPVIFVQAGDHEGEPPEAFPRAVGIANYINAATPSAVLSLLATVRAAEARIEALQMQMLLVSEGIVTTILIENGGDPDYPDVGPDLWTESTRVLVRELSRIERVAGALPPTPFRWVEMLRAWEAESQASGDYSTPEREVEDA